MIDTYSIEVLPRTAAKIDRFQDILPSGTRVYIANIEGTALDDMVTTARRIRDEGFAVMPHFPARLIPDAETFELWLKRYHNEAGVDEALVLGGGTAAPAGEFSSSIQLLKTGLFDKYGFQHLHVAGHPEGNKEIDTDGTTSLIDDALMWKQGFSMQTDAEMAITTQFCFEAAPVIQWIERLRTLGVVLPVHLGLAGPTKLQTLLKYALSCGVGPSMKVLKRRAPDVTKLLIPYEPTQMYLEISEYVASHPEAGFAQFHFFPLGGIKNCTKWAASHFQPQRLAKSA